MLSAGFVIGGAARVLCQAGIDPGGPILGKERTPTKAEEIREAQERLLEEYAPEFYDFPRKIQGIEAEIERVTADLADKKIDEVVAKVELLPLVREERELQDDPEYLVSQRIARVALTSPAYLAEKRKLTDRFRTRRP